MKTKKILHILALTVLGAASVQAAHAGPLPLQNASITGIYNGAATGMLGLDHGFVPGPGSNTTTLDPTDVGVEFLTADYLFGFDFAADGELTILANYAVSPGDYTMQFDFGNSLADPINAFTLVSSNGATGAPLLWVIDSHTIALDLKGIDWTEFATLTARIGTSAPVAMPEPATPAIMLAGVAGLALARRKRKPGA